LQKKNILLKNSLQFIGNGQVEASNKIIKRILSKTRDRYKRDWHEKLPYALWAYCTSVRTTARETSFLLVYGNGVVVSRELDIPYLRISLHGYILDEEARKARLQQ